MVLEVITVVQQTLTRTTKTTTTTEMTRNQELATHPVTYVVKQTTPQINAILELTQRIHRFPVIEDRQLRASVYNTTHKTT